MITIWGGATSRTMRAHWACHELGLDYEPKLIGSRGGFTQTSEFRDLNPKEKIPVLTDEQFVLTESAAIVTYLFDTYGKKRFIPEPYTKDRALYNQWISFIQMELDAHTLYVIRKHRDLESLYGAAPAAVEAAIDGFNKQIRVADRFLESNEYLVGDSFSGADLLMTTILTWAEAYGFELSSNLADYSGRLTSRKAYKSAANLNFSITPND